jgi:hypothetical protein
MLTDQKSIMTSMMELSLTGDKVDTPSDPERALLEDDSQKNLAFVLEKVEGCSGVIDVPGRFLVHNGDLIEMDSDSFGQSQKVHLFLLNDSLMIGVWLQHRRGPVKYRFQTLYELDSLAVVNVRDGVSVKNAFKILMFPDTRMFQAESPKAKRQWLDILEETKRKKTAQENQRKEAMASQERAARAVASPTASKTKTPQVPVQTESTRHGSNTLDGELMHVDWVQELPEDVDVCIAQRDFEGAVDLILKINEYLDNCPKHSSVREYKSRIEHRVKQLTEVLMQELQVSPERSIRGGPRSARRAVAQLIRLGKSVQACELFLRNRGAICRYGMRQLKTESNTSLYVSSMSKLFFNSLMETGKEFMKAFPQHFGCFSAFMLWSKQEVQYFVGVFASQVFVGKSNISTVAECVSEARACCEKLSVIGLELSFTLNRLFAPEVEKLIQLAGDNQVDAIRHRAADDHWRPVNYQNVESMEKFETDMKQLGVEDIKQYTFDECFTYLTANTIQFTRSYVSFCDDLLKLYMADHHHLIVTAFRDIFSGQVHNIQKSASLDKFKKELTVIRQNTQFLAVSLLPLVKKKFLFKTGMVLTDMETIESELKQI